MKFNSTGSLQWNKTWGQSLLDAAHSLKVSSCKSIYISGITQNPGLAYTSYFLANYNSSGVLQWNSTFERESYDVNTIQVGNEGEIYFVGSIAHNNQDLYLGMVNSSSAIQYALTWGQSGSDISSMILLDKLNNIYIGGYTSSIGEGGADILILKYKGWGTIENMIIDAGNSENTKNRLLHEKYSKYFIIFLLLIISFLGISILLILRRIAPFKRIA